MRIPIANLLATAVLGTFISTAAFAQGMYQPVPQGLVGAGGTGGAGGGATGVERRVVVIGETDYVNRNPSYTTHVRSSAPPPMDPSRLVYEADCTKGFDTRGKGNLRCM
jgi:hypothetical protein